MEILTGGLYFISDAFFQKVQDPYLKINYENTKRPHYFAFNDNKNGLYWLVPCSSKIEKFEQLIRKKQEQHKSTDAIKIVKRYIILKMPLHSRQNLLRHFGHPPLGHPAVGTGDQSVRPWNPEHTGNLRSLCPHEAQNRRCPYKEVYTSYIPSGKAP